MFDVDEEENISLCLFTKTLQILMARRHLSPKKCLFLESGFVLDVTNVPRFNLIHALMDSFHLPDCIVQSANE